PNGAPIYLKDIAEVKLGHKERESYARLDGLPVITLNVIKRSGENLVEASDKVREIVRDMEENEFPKDLNIDITSDQSTQTRNTLNDLMNTIIIGFILVTIILMFFMGTVNALFVGLSVPISTFLAFIIMPAIGFALNMIVLFALLLALGIVVDDAIVVIENTHRIFHNTRMSIIKAAKYAAGEVFIPVLAGTLTTLAPFVPLAFWPGIIGEFMFYLPITLILVLTASLVVAFFINPVFAVTFMKRGDEPKKPRKMWFWLAGIEVIALLSYLMGNIGFGNFLQLLIILVLLNKYVFTGWIHAFQHKTLPAFMGRYDKVLRWMLRGWNPYLVLGSVFGLLILSIILTAVRAPKVVFFPEGDPNFIYTYISMPVGTGVEVTDSITRVVEERVRKVVGENNQDVESIISNVAIGAGDPMQSTGQAESHKGKVSVVFKEFVDRTGAASGTYLDKVREQVKDIPGAEITVEKEQNGPPTGKPINIEISGEDFTQLVRLSKAVKRYIDSMQIPGIEELKTDLQDQNPEITIDIDREHANREGISTGQIGMEIRTAIFGKEATTFKRDEDEFPVQIRYSEGTRNDIDALLGSKITYRDMNSGQIRQIPISSVAKVEYTTTYGGIKRKNLKRVITLSSNVTSGYNANEINNELRQAFASYPLPEGFEINQTGEQEEQEETAGFLQIALIVSFGLIFLILVAQFNSVSKPIIILTEIIFSVIGVLLGFAIFRMPISIVMTGVGIVALAGIVVKNGILLVEFTDELKARGSKTINSIVEAGRTRLSPVLLTATATVLGLIPLALGMNINFFTLFSEFKPDFYIGGESAAFWGPLAWTIIFGLTFATFLTLLVVPVMYLIAYRMKVWFKRKGVIKKLQE
nr:efflux RND transporter permease subunit [Bacteroidota bacterium]